MGQEVTVENLYRLVEHQVSVLDKLSSGPVTEEEWHQVIKDIFLAGGGLLSPQVWRAIRLMSEFKLHTDPGYVRRLYLMLIEEFPAIVKMYVGMGLVRPTPPPRPLTTLQAPRSFEEALENASEEAEEEGEFEEEEGFEEGDEE
jgi:hypothetical protein